MRFLIDYANSWKENPFGQMATTFFVSASSMFLYTSLQQFQKNENASIQDYINILIPIQILAGTLLFHINNVIHTRSSTTGLIANSVLAASNAEMGDSTEVSSQGNCLAANDTETSDPTEVAVNPDGEEIEASDNKILIH